MTVESVCRRYRAPDERREHAEMTAPLMIAVVDIVGSTALARALGDLVYAELIEEFRYLARCAAGSHRAREFAETGDGFIHLYDAPEDALEGSLAIFRGNAERNRQREVPIVLRGGLHHGQLVRSSTSLVGVALNDACELGQASPGGKLWLSPEAHARLGHRAMRTKGTLVRLPKSGWTKAYAVRWANGLNDRAAAMTSASIAAA